MNALKNRRFRDEKEIHTKNVGFLAKNTKRKFLRNFFEM